MIEHPPPTVDAPLILASASPRRRELLSPMGVPFEVIVSPFREPERKPAMVPPHQWAAAVANFKARAVAAMHPRRWVLAADTLVSCRGEILNKASDMTDARRMLELQAGVPSDVFTGVALIRVGEAGDYVDFRTARTVVWMRDDRAIREAYLASGDWEGKAGAYGIQDVGDRLVERIEGEFSNVVGLPIGLVRSMFLRAGFALGEAR